VTGMHKWLASANSILRGLLDMGVVS
jgi:hypothetical protein